VHPIDFIESLVADEGRITEVQISVYRYHPQSLLDDRTTYRVPVNKLRATYERLAQQLSEQEDIAFHSVVRMGKTKRHFGLLDFQIADAKRVEEVAELLMSENRARRAALVHSGRSYHLYLGVLLSHAAWVKFMGRILLLNAREEPPTVDPRWVGHRLMGGYGALRWSANVRPDLLRVVRQW